MKSFIISLIILIALVTFITIDSYLISNKLENLEYTLENHFPKDESSYEEIYSCALVTEERFQNMRRHLSCIYNEEALFNLQECIEDLKSASENESYENAVEAKNRLSAHIQHLRRFSVFNLDYII